MVLYNETARIRLQMQQAFDGGAWHGPSVTEIVAGIDAATAMSHAIAGAHSIWEIVNHLIATQRILLRRLDGDATAINLPEAIEWPPIADASEAAWNETLRELTELDRTLRARIAAFPDARLDEPLIPGGSSAYNNFHGYVQHNLYHAAQIGLIKKLLTQA